jgi:hypothetical protein
LEELHVGEVPDVGDVSFTLASPQICSAAPFPVKAIVTLSPATIPPPFTQNGPSTIT